MKKIRNGITSATPWKDAADAAETPKGANSMTEKDADTNKHIAGVQHEVFRTLPPEDRAFLEIIDRLGYSLDALHTKATAGGAAEAGK